MKADFGSIKEPGDGETIVLLTDSFDPATLDHERAIRALLALKGVSSVWACPLGGYGKEAKDMCTILCSAIGDKRLGMCTMAFDRDIRQPLEAKDMCLKRFKGLLFKVAAITERFASQADLVVQFGNSAGVSPKGAMLLPLKSYVSVPSDVSSRIGNGSDESRNFVPAVWNYIQKHKLYRS